MKRKIMLGAVLATLVLAPFFLTGAFTNPAANIRWNSVRAMRDGGDIDTWMTEVESYLNGTSELPDAATFGSTNSLGTGTFTGGTITSATTLDDGVTDSPSLTFKDATDETAAFVKTDSGTLGLTTLAADGFKVLVGNFWVGNGTPGTASMNGEDAYIEGQLEVDGTAQFDGAVTAASTLGVTGVLTASNAITLSNGLTIDQPANNYLEFTENSDTLQMIFGSNKLELGAGGTGVNTIDFNDLDALEDIDTITLENGQIIAGTVDNRIELTENSETFALIFGSNTIQMGTDSGIATFDFNDVDALIGVQDITGDNSNKLDFSINNRFEFGDNSETVGLDLTTSNRLTLTTDSGVDTIDVNDLDAVIGLESLTGDNGQKIDYAVNNRIELGDNSETFGFDFTTANQVTFTTDSGVTVVDCNQMALTGFKRVVEAHTADDTLTAAESGSVHTNYGAGGTVALTLPTAAAGQTFTFKVMADAQALRITPAAGDAIYIGASAGSAAEYWWADAAGETLTLTAVDATNWVADAYIGTWTQETP